MKENLEAALVEIIEKANNGIDSAAGFLSAEIPDVVSQLLSFMLFSNTAWCLLGAAIIFLSKKLYTKGRDSECEYDSQALYCLSLVTLLSGTPVLFFNALEFAKIIIAPKLYLIEYAASLVK